MTDLKGALSLTCEEPVKPVSPSVTASCSQYFPVRPLRKEKEKEKKKKEMEEKKENEKEKEKKKEI